MYINSKVYTQNFNRSDQYFRSYRRICKDASALNFEKLWTRFSQNHVFKVGVHDISKTASSICIKFLNNLFEYIF